MKIIDAETAINALPSRGKIHCLAGFIGADWERRQVVRELKMAKKIAWIDHLLNHNLAIEAGPESTWHGRSVLCFDVRPPAP